MKKRKTSSFLKKYAQLALGAGVAAGAALSAEAQNAPAASDPAPVAGAKSPSVLTPPAANPQVPISVVYGPPPGKSSIFGPGGGSPTGKISGVPPAKKPKAADKPTADQEKSAKPAAGGDTAKKP